MATFKDDVQRETFFAPSGHYIVIRPQIGRDGWCVRVLNFTNFKHREYPFPDEAAARSYAVGWRI